MKEIIISLVTIIVVIGIFMLGVKLGRYSMKLVEKENDELRNIICELNNE